MAQGVSIHIGLNRVDPAQYGGWDGKLYGCINDAKAMRDIASRNGYYPSTMLLDEQATSANVLAAIGQAAQTLTTGDILVLTYSGHGGQIPDENGDEDDGQDETWVLYDRQLLDDELYLMWSQFEPGVRIFILSDSCHSGTINKLVRRQLNSLSRQVRAGQQESEQDLEVYRSAPISTVHQNYQEHQDQYRAIQWTAARGKKAIINASVLLISGCQDWEVSADGTVNGAFTGALLKVWSSGQFSGDYRTFHRRIQQELYPEQNPNFIMAGTPSPSFEAETPFTISSSQWVSAPPRITVSPSWYGTWPPEFLIAPGTNPYYAVEVTIDSYLFDGANYGDRRTDGNFFASWVAEPLQTDPVYKLPQPVWDRFIAQSSIVYYRILTSSIPNGWQSILASTGDEESMDAPYLVVTRALHIA